MTVTGAAAPGRNARPPGGLRALVVGASGLVGRQLLALLLLDDRFASVQTWVRRPLGEAHPKLTERIVEFENVVAAVTAHSLDVAFCCLGTTIRKAGSQSAFRRVDYDYVLACAKAARLCGARHFILVSAVGASARSRVFYSRVKGELEDSLSELDYPRLTFVRPSFLAGERTEHRSGERLALAVLTPISRLVPVAWRPISGIAVARAMLDAAIRGNAPDQPPILRAPGRAHGDKSVEVLESARLQDFL